MNRVVLYDAYTLGHHTRYISIISKRLLDQGYKVLFLTYQEIPADWLEKKDSRLIVKRLDSSSLKS